MNLLVGNEFEVPHTSGGRMTFERNKLVTTSKDCTQMFINEMYKEVVRKLLLTTAPHKQFL